MFMKSLGLLCALYLSGCSGYALEAARPPADERGLRLAALGPQPGLLWSTAGVAPANGKKTAPAAAGASSSDLAVSTRMEPSMQSLWHGPR